MVQLSGPWQFHTGDSQVWADPAFDDSGWSALDPGKSYEEQGYKGYSGLSWYRLRFAAPEWNEPLALIFPVVGDSYQVFVNGQIIGQAGGMPPQQRVIITNQVMFPIPPGIVAAGKPLVVAVRVWRWERLSMFDGGGLAGVPRIGSLSAIAEWQQTSKHARDWVETDAVVTLLANLLTALAGLALFALRPKEREYLWFGLAQVLWAVGVAMHIMFVTRPMAYVPSEIALALVTSAAMLLNVEFFVTLMGQRKRILYWSAIASTVLLVFAFLPITISWINEVQVSAAQMILELAYGVCVTGMIFEGARKGSIEARLLLGPFTFSFLCNVINPLLGLPAVGRVPWLRALADRFNELTAWPFPFRTVVLAGDIAMFSVVAVLVFRYARSRTDEERFAAELEAARAVQQVLVPEKIPTVEGFQIECIYRPMGDVGGDFFQILPLSNCELLAVIGDVSGKGMPAAMTVSLLVGMIRMLVRATQRPSEILAAINQNMMGRTSGGFTTCLILHIFQDGRVIAANAGHLAPYVNGREVHLESGLPLGIDAQAAYDETQFDLAHAEQMTLLTDGVLEARTAAGELFGFERAARLSGEHAAIIATAAQEFGQEDDITVLSLRRKPVCNEASRESERQTTAASL